MLEKLRHLRWGALFTAGAFLSVPLACNFENSQKQGAGAIFADKRVASLAQFACSGNVSAMSKLSSKSHEVNATGKDGLTPLIWAVRCGNAAGVRTLLKADANPNQATKNDTTPVGEAASQLDGRILRLLLENGGSPNSLDGGRSGTALITALSLGVQSNNWQNYDVLLAKGADVNSVYKDQTVAEAAVSLGEYNRAIQLLELGYSHDLNSLALSVHTTHLANENDEVDVKKRLINELEKRGVDYDRISRSFDSEAKSNKRLIEERENAEIGL